MIVCHCCRRVSAVHLFISLSSVIKTWRVNDPRRRREETTLCNNSIAYCTHTCRIVACSSFRGNQLNCISLVRLYLKPFHSHRQRQRWLPSALFRWQPSARPFGIVLCAILCVCESVWMCRTTHSGWIVSLAASSSTTTTITNRSITRSISFGLIRPCGMRRISHIPLKLQHRGGGGGATDIKIISAAHPHTLKNTKTPVILLRFSASQR